MYSVDEVIEQIDQESEREDNLDEVEETAIVTQENEDENATKIKAKAKRKLGSRPKLDAERLKGPRGLICMEKMFSDLKFKGNGYEKQDLNKIMNTLQYWCHRLYPKFTFDDCLAQLERLGTKKPVITLKKKILFDMVDDLIPNDSEIIDDVIESQPEELNEFDMLLNQEPIPTSFTAQPAITTNVELTEEQKEMIARNRQLAAERRQARLDAMKEKQEDSSQTPSNSQSLNLTEDQRLIIEKNRLLAVEKRRQLHNKLNISTSKNINREFATNQENDTENIDDFAKENEKINDSINQENEKINDFINQENENIDESTNQENEMIIDSTSQENEKTVDSINQENEKIVDSTNQENENIVDSTNQENENIDESTNQKNEKIIDSTSQENEKTNDYINQENEKIVDSTNQENEKIVDSTNQENEIEKIDNSTLTEATQSEMQVDLSQEINSNQNLIETEMDVDSQENN